MASWSIWIFMVLLVALVVGVGIVLYRISIEPPQPPCSKDSDCPSGQTCNVNVCVCSGNTGCQNGEICSNGKCIQATPCTDGGGECPTGQTCINNICYDTNTKYVQDVVLIQGSGSVCPAGYQLIEVSGTPNEDLVDSSASLASPLYMCAKYGPYTGPGSVVTDIVVSKGDGLKAPVCPGNTFTTLTYQQNGQGPSLTNIQNRCTITEGRSQVGLNTILCVDKTGFAGRGPVKDIETAISNCSSGYTLSDVKAINQDLNNASLTAFCGGPYKVLCLQR